MFRSLMITAIALAFVKGLSAEAKLSDDLIKAMESAGNNQHIGVLIWMEEQGDLSGFGKGNYHAKAQYLRDLASRTQRPVLEFLQAHKDGVMELKPFWFVNLIYAKVTPPIIRELAEIKGVAFIDISRKTRILGGQPSRTDITKTKTVEWNVSKIKADSVWYQYGLSGDGVIVGVLDTGIDPSHPALAGNFSGFFFDGVNGRTNPYDDHGHGTHVSGTLAGGDGPGPFTEDIGIAYNAQIVSAKGFDASGTGEDQWVLACFQWFIELKADSGVNIVVVSNSWGSTDRTNLTYWNPVLQWRQFDIVPVFASGNSGPSSETAGIPGNYPTVISVGATASNDDIAYFSSRGPAPSQNPWNDQQYWSRNDWNYIKPDISAPGVSVRSSTPGGGYDSWDGTSMATPHVTATIALMFEKNPGLDYETVYSILTNYAVDYPSAGAPYPNNDYGWGRLNALKAVEATPSLDRAFIRTLAAQFDDGSGNNNGRPDPGETVSMILPVRNLGADAHSVVVELSTDEQLITITDAISNYGDVPSQDTSLGDGFEFFVDSAWRSGLSGDFYIHITGEDSMGTFEKWDTISIQIGEPMYFEWYSEGFEDGLGDWAATGTPTWSVTSEASHSGSNSVTESPGGDYPNNMDAYLTLQEPLDLSDAYFARIRFWHTYSFEESWDFGYVEASTSLESKEWTQLLSVTGEQSAWTEQVVDLSDFIGEPTVYIRFHTTSDFTVTEDGWHIDDFVFEKDVPLEGIHISLRNLEVYDYVGDGDGVLDPGEAGSLIMTLVNRGTDDLTNGVATLTTTSPYVTITNNTLDIGNVPAASQLIDTGFVMQADPNTPRETVAEFTMVITGDGNYADTAQFSLVIGQKLRSDPSGPDNYGYYAYENSDSSYPSAPEFNWIEIAPSAGGSGTSISLGDDDNEVVNLPFSFQYYGQTYTQLTICSNGWVAMGSVNSSDFSNSGIPDQDGPRAMIAPFWDDLNPLRGGEVAYYHDAANHAFIVEWKDVPHFGDPSALETFEVILYDPAYYTTPTGDGEIVFQYYQLSGEPNFTVGIESPDETDGIQIYYDGDLDRLANPIESGRAIKFTTSFNPAVAEDKNEDDRFVLSFNLNRTIVRKDAELRFSLPNRMHVKITAYDATGRLVSRIFDDEADAGVHTLSWNASKLRSGIYFIKFKADRFSKTQKLIVIR